MKNPKWIREEEILLLDLYFTAGRMVLNKNDTKVIELSELLNSFDYHENKGSTFRNPTGISQKLANIAYVDPEYKGGLSGASKLDKEIWEEFSTNPERLKTEAELIIKKNREMNLNHVAEEDFYYEVKENESFDDDENEFPEGKISYNLHRMRERNQKLIREVKERAKEKDEICCSICGFDFHQTYGEIGKDYIECHHTKPVSELSEGEMTNIEDMILVCSNCHRMLHRKRPWITSDHLKDLLCK